MTRICLSIGVALSLLVAAAARADEDGQRARALYEKGMAHFQLEEYDAAITAWESGFRIKPVPEFLYNIAQSYRLSKRPEKALSFYRNYLRMNPKAPNRVEVERHIAQLQRAVDENQKASTAAPLVTKPITPDSLPSGAKPPPAPTTPAPTVASAPKPAPAPAPAPGVEPAPAAPAAAAPAPAAPTPARADVVAKAPDKRPITKRPWFWGVVGGGAALVVGAIIVGAVVATSGDSTKTLPALTF